MTLEPRRRILRPRLGALLFAGLAAFTPMPANADSADKPAAVDLNVQLEREQVQLNNLEATLDMLQQQLTRSQEKRHEERRSLIEDNPKRSPETVEIFEQPNLRVRRMLAKPDLIYEISARQATVSRILEAISATSGLSAAIDRGIEETPEKLAARVDIELRGAPLHFVLEALTGALDLDFVIDQDGILIAPAAGGDAKAAERLREKALDNYERALVLFPAHARAPEGYLGLSRYYMRKGEYAAAAQTLVVAIEKFPRAASAGAALLLLGECRERQELFTEASKNYLRYLSAYLDAPDLDQVTLRLARVYRTEGKNEEALAVLNSFAVNFPDSSESPAAFLEAARCLMTMGKHPDALLRLDNVAAKYPDHAKRLEAESLAAECLIQTHEYLKARNRLSLCLNLAADPSAREQAIYRIGDCFLAEGNDFQALSAYHAALRAYPAGAMKDAGMARLAQCYVRMGLFERVSRILEKLPTNVKESEEGRALILALCRHYAETDNADRGIALLQSLNWDSRGENAHMLLCRAQLLLQRGSYDLALQECERALKLTEDPALRIESLQLMAEAHRRKGQLALAAQVYGGNQP